jgi:hypothetical protein
MKTFARVFFAAAVFAVTALPAQAGSIVYGNNARFGNVDIEAFDVSTGNKVDGFLLPDPAARSDNGRGVAVLGHDIYYTTADSGNIWKTNDSPSHPDLGVVVNTGFSGIANVATDGVYLYANNYQAVNGPINKYTPAGVLVGSITLSGPDAQAGDRDGFEVQNNSHILSGATTFIANRGDGEGPYDVYDSNGVEIISDFIDPAAHGSTFVTGIAFDGTDYYVSDPEGNKLLEFDIDGNYVGTIDLSGDPSPNGQRLLEDLSAVGNTVNNQVSGAPAPAGLVLAGTGLVSLFGYRRRMRKVTA